MKSAQISLKYQWLGMKIQRRFRVLVPQSWSQMPPAAMLDLCLQLTQGPADWMGLHILGYFLPKAVKKRARPQDLQPLLPLINWIWERPLYHPVIAKIPAGSQRLAMPSGLLYSGKMIELITGHKYLLRYLKRGDPKSLDLFIAIWCRPLTAAGSRRPFSMAAARINAARLSDTPMAYKIYFFLFYCGCLKIMRQKYPLVFAEPDPDLNDNLAAAHPDNWRHFCLAAAGLPNLGGDYDKVKYKAIHDVLAAADFSARQAEQRKAEAEAAARKQKLR